MNRLTKILEKQYSKKAIKDPNEYLIFYMNPDNLKEWFVIARNLDSEESPEWKDGVFLFRLKVPDDFPMSPPKFIAMNETGVYTPDVDTNCISIGHYHKEDGWRPVLGMTGFAMELANGLMNRAYLVALGGIGLIDSNDKQIKKICKKSLSSLHEKYPELMADIESTYKAYSAKWDLSKCSDELKRKLAFGNVKFIDDAAESSTTSTANL